MAKSIDMSRWLVIVRFRRTSQILAWFGPWDENYAAEQREVIESRLRDDVTVTVERPRSAVA